MRGIAFISILLLPDLQTLGNGRNSTLYWLLFGTICHVLAGSAAILLSGLAIGPILHTDLPKTFWALLDLLDYRSQGADLVA